ncbi:MAG TPA: tripartite tricarboxylate transporter permease, partial [Pseudorhizobium sp.]|nr:tripartite tricarboxylate transporter permease [Pseudorhizobium sp.]
MDNLLLGFSTALMPENLIACFVGVFLGTAIGVIPGIGAMAAIALLLPLTFSLDPTTGIVMLAGVYYGAEYGGSTASILLNLPGTPSNAITCLDGYPMAQQGRAGVALFITTVASFVGGSIGILVLSNLTPLIVEVGQAFGPAEY